jgi:hypothetical protein
MPEFVFNTGDKESTAKFRALDSFTQGYIECAFWTCELDDAAFSDLEPEALAKMIEDCQAFQQGSKHLLEQAYTEHPIGAIMPDGTHVNEWDERLRASGARAVMSRPYDENQAGHDFWLTRNHHGAGFWDRGLGKVGDELTKNAHPYGDAHLERAEDGKVYLL